MSSDFLTIPDQNELPDLQVAKPGEYELQITSAEKKTSEKNPDVKYVQVVLSHVQSIECKDVYHTIFYPRADANRKDLQNFQRKVRYFLEAFGLPLSFPSPDAEDPDFSEWQGATGFALLAQESDAEYGDKNKIKKFIPQR